MSDPAPRLNSAGKVAIPALRPQSSDSPGSASNPGKTIRTAKACAECKSKKIKCSGKRPTCDYCQLCQIPCTYPDGKREKNKKVVERGDRLLRLLHEASALTSLPPHILKELRALESEVAGDDQSVISTTGTTAQKRPNTTTADTEEDKRPRHGSPEAQEGGEADAEATEVGSEESVDVSAEDFNRSEQSRATGFIGKNSEVVWAQRLANLQAENAENPPAGNHNRAAALRQPAGSRGEGAVLNFSYHQDDTTLKLNNVEKDELPPLDLASRLVDSYFNNSHDFFPILIKPDFVSQFQSCMHSETPDKAPQMWRAILNLVLAIGAKFSHLVGVSWRGDERDHLLYHTRALQLSPLNEDTVVQPDLQRIQILGLTSFYYLTIGHINRSWVMLGLACRQAEALGLHLRNIAPSLSAASREKRARVWWSLYYLEYLLCENTGRPTIINSQFCSVQPLAPLHEGALTTHSGSKQLEEWYSLQIDPAVDLEKRQPFLELEMSPSPINHFRSRIGLSMLTLKVFADIYSAATVSKPWLRTQDEIFTLSQEVDHWYRALPRPFQFAREVFSGEGQFTRERIILGFCFYSAKMLLNRPCLCRVDLRIRDQTRQSKDIDLDRARECIMAAKSISDLLPDNDDDDAGGPDPVWLYKNGPWWCIVHYFMQAITVLMLELAFNEFHMRGEPMGKAASADITTIVGKLVRWLSAMAAAGDAAAVGACRQVRAQFEGFKPFRKPNIADLFESIDFEPDIVGRPRDQRLTGVLQQQQQQQQQGTEGMPGQIDDISMQYVSSEGIVYGAPPPSVGQPAIGDEPAAHLGLSFLPEQQHAFGGEPWDVSDDMVDWNNIFFDNPYDIYNPFLQANQAAEGEYWTGGGDGAGYGGFDITEPGEQQQQQQQQ